MNIDTIPESTDCQAQDLQTKHGPATVAPASAFYGGSINILIVDDEPKNLTVLEAVLDDPGYRLVRAESAEQALLALVSEEFALIILDIRMPSMTGFELAKMIKERKKTAQVPIIFLTAYYNEDQQVLEGYVTGAVDYLQKPVNPAILRSKVAVFAELHSKNRALLAEVTERRRADEELRELNATLEQRVTDRTEALRESEGKFRGLLETAPDAVVIVDQQGIIVLANALTERLFGYSRAELLGQRVEMLMPARFRNRHDVHREGYIAGPHARGMGAGLELLGQRKDGSEFPIEVSLSPLETNQGMLVSSVIRDITERKQAEKTLQEEKHKAEAANQAKSEFLANMSHEIRTPMNAILGLSTILAMAKDLPKKQQEIVNTLQLSAQSLLGLINDLLDIAKIETNNVDLERIPFTFNEVVSEVFSVLSMKAQEKGIALDHVSSPLNTQKFLGDPLRIRQVLMNLVSNAVKFTGQGGVTVSMTTSPDEEPGCCYVHVAISDTGIGIAPNKLEGIFDKFTQGDASTTRKYGGTGLGLAISKNLAEIMGGSITIKSQADKGSEFTMHLPLEVADEVSAYTAIAEDDQKETPESQTMHGCVLLAEDYQPNVMVAVYMLEFAGYSCDVASDGKEALEKIRANRGKYVAVLMDVQMPNMDGFEATKSIREEEKAQGLSHLPIIAMTAHALSGDRERCLSAGMDDYISKPFDPQELQEKLAVCEKPLVKAAGI